MWEVVVTARFEEWYMSLAEVEADAIGAAVDVLAETGRRSGGHLSTG